MKLEAWWLEDGRPSIDAPKEQAYEWLRTAREHWMDLCLVCITLDWGILIQNQISANISA